MKIVLDISPSQANNLPSPLREEVLQAANKRLRREETRIQREIADHTQVIAYLQQQGRQLGEWEELLG